MISSSDVLNACSDGSWSNDLGIGGFTLDYSKGFFGLPSMKKGASWLVVQAISEEGEKFAIRIPHNKLAYQPSALNRLQRLESVIEKTGIKWFTKFKLIENELKVGSEVLPVMVMPWEDGKTLPKFLAENRKNPDKLQALSENLRNIGNSMVETGFDHGDFSGGNILVRPNGSVVLIDPDSLLHHSCTVKKTVELGHPSLSHPDRKSRDIGPGLFVFSLELILLIIEAIMNDSSQIEDNPDPEAFFFDEKDLISPEKSDKFTSIKSIVCEDKFDKIMSALKCMDMIEVAKIFYPKIGNKLEPRVFFDIEEIVSTKPITLHNRINGKSRPMRRKMRVLSLAEEMKRGD